MRRVIMWNMVTLDGFFEGKESWEIDWHEYVWGEELERFSSQGSSSFTTSLPEATATTGDSPGWPGILGNADSIAKEDEAIAMEIRISIQTTKPLIGTATAGRRGPLRFEGWLELLRVLSALLGLEGDSDTGREST